MEVLAYNPSDDLFFIGATFEEFSKLEEEYRIECEEFSVEVAKRFIDEETRFTPAEESLSYFQVIKDMYGIDIFPEICFSAHRNLSVIKAMPYDFPFHHMWNAYSPWKRIKATRIDNLHDLTTLQCEERT